MKNSQKNLEFMLSGRNNIGHSIFIQTYEDRIQKKYETYIKEKNFERIEALREMTHVKPAKEVIAEGLELMFNERKKHNGRRIYLHYIRKLVEAAQNIDEEKIADFYIKMARAGLCDYDSKKGWLEDFIKLREITNIPYRKKVLAYVQREYFKCLYNRNFEGFAKLREAGICPPAEEVVQAGFRVFVKRCATRDIEKLLEEGYSIKDYTADFINREYKRHIAEGRLEVARRLINATKVKPSPETKRFFIHEFLK